MGEENYFETIIYICVEMHKRGKWTPEQVIDFLERDPEYSEVQMYYDMLGDDTEGVSGVSVDCGRDSKPGSP